MNTINTLAILGAKYLYFVIIALAFLWFLRQRNNIKKELVAYGLIALPVMYALLKVAALFYYDPRPFTVGHFTPLIPHAPDNGFPSDHTILSSAIAAVVYPYSKKLGLVLWLLALVVGISRVYVGIHHFIDIAASMVIAAAVAFVVYKYVLPKVTKTKIYNSLWPH